MSFGNLGFAEITIVLAVLSGGVLAWRALAGRPAPPVRSASTAPGGLIHCVDCGRQISSRAATCPQCGAPAPRAVFAATKSRGVAVLLALVLGGIGAHKFYLDRPGVGLLYLLFVWTAIPSVIGFLEAISYVLMSDERFAAMVASR